MKTQIKASLIAALVATGAAGTASAMIPADAFNELARAVTNHASSPAEWTYDVRAEQDDATVQIFRLSQVSGGAALDAYLDNNTVDLSDFQSAVAKNGKLSSRLHGAGYSASDVVAYRGGSSDIIWLFVDDTK